MHMSIDPRNFGIGVVQAALCIWEERRKEERVAALAQVRAHVRVPGEYRGTRRIAGLQRQIPNAVTRCGGEATGKDHNLIGARRIIRDQQEPFLSDMCPACLASCEADGAKPLTHLSDRRGTASHAQVNFLRRLLQQAQVALFRGGPAAYLDSRSVQTLSKREASAAIDELKAALARGWK